LAAKERVLQGLRGLYKKSYDMKTAALIANGEIFSPEVLRPLILKHQRIVAVDGGLCFCRALGIQPHLIVGDFDSCPAELLEEHRSIPQISLPAEKDQTDLEVAIEHEFDAGTETVTLFGAWGKRIDHSLTNALFLARRPGKLFMETETEIVYALSQKAQIQCGMGQTLSLIPIFGPVSGIATSGLKWELKGGRLDQNFVGISNICLKETISVEIERGIILCCLLKVSS
jgi:thiamine pyrophosphokinase